ncbi:MAG: Nif11-like leader peptide family RiPP precursor [Desulfotomaculaceae bacterium]|nr:Nif11-like leader peptide family RiPP precursor [Desulfotomaculaceae bacterium]
MADRPMLTQEQIADLVKDMSDNAKSFVQKLAAEESFQNKFASIKSAEEMLQITSAEGITISMEELKNIMLAASKTVLDTGSELSDDALERVAGGGSEDDYQYAQAAVAI